MAKDYYDSGQVYFGRPDEAYVGLSPEEQDALQRRLVAAQVQPEPAAPRVPEGLLYSPLQDANVNAFTVQQAQEEEQRRLAQASERDRIMAEEQAIKMRGRMNYQRDVESGVPPAEALRRNISDLLYSNPAQMAGVLKATAPEGEFMPQVIKNDGNELVQLGPNRWQYVKAKAPTMPQSNKDERSMLMEQIKAARGGLLYDPKTDEQKLKPLQDRFMELGTNWQGAPVTGALPPAMTAPPPAEGPARPTTKAEVEKLPKGAPFINPADGKVYYKK